MKNTNLAYWLALHRCPGIGPINFIKIIKQFPDIVEFFSLSGNAWNQLFVPKISQNHLKNPNWVAVDDDLSWGEKPNNHIITYLHPSYPKLLKQSPTPPPILFATGNIKHLHGFTLGIIGSRHPTAYGRKHAQYFSEVIAETGFIVVSGLAIGIDKIAHTAAINKNMPTIAVLANSPDTCYPKQHQALLEVIQQNGVSISEFPTKTKLHPKHFPRRNRIISGISHGVFIPEASLRSGSLITARHALEQNREIFTLPGDIQSPLSSGCHALIKEGAQLITTPEQIINNITPLYPVSLLTHSINCLNSIDKILKSIDYTPTSIQYIINKNQDYKDKIYQYLNTLELDGKISKCLNGYIRSP